MLMLLTAAFDHRTKTGKVSGVDRRRRVSFFKTVPKEDNLTHENSEIFRDGR
jgi:hypothetical protein